MSSSPSPLRPIAGLDGLRAIAVAAVILFHLAPGALPGGYLGVDIFFVISGFLITGLLLREREVFGRIRLGTFWLRRARRLLPALGVLVLVCGTAALVIGGDSLVHLGRQILGAASFSSNWVAITAGQSYFDSTTPELFRNLWSLAVEEQFYLVWPVIILGVALLPSRRIRASIVTMMAIASALAMGLLFVPGADVTRVYYGTDTHSFGLAIGAVLAVLSFSPLSSHGQPARRALPIAGAIALAVVITATALLGAEVTFAYRGGLVLVALLTALAIAGATATGSWLGRVLEVGALRWIGRRSYGLYLWHWPVFVLVLAALPGVNRTGAAEWILGGIALVITVAAATLSYRYIEQPIRRNGFRASAARWFGSRRIASVIASIVVLGMLGATVTAVVHDPGEGAAQSVIEKGDQALRPAPTTSASPLAPVLPGGDQIDAIGDSVMLASAPELQAVFPGISIDAVVSRQASAAPAIVQSMVDRKLLRPTLLIGLGTNGPVDPGILTRLLGIVGPGHQIVMINVQAPRAWVDTVNSELTTFAQHYRSVELANWKDAIAGKLDLLARDQIHPGARGGLVYVQAVTEALQRLADLPPRIGPNDYGLAPVPI